MRNLVLTGNPVYPIDLGFLPGMFPTARSPALRTFDGIRKVLSGGYYSLPPVLWEALLIGAVAAVVRFGGEVFHRPLVRAAVFGPFVGVAIFVLKSPYDEMRFVYPSIVMLFACATVAFSTMAKVDAAWAAILLVLALTTNFVRDVQFNILPYILPIAVTGAIFAVGWPKLPIKARPIVTAMLAFAAGAWVFVYWHAYINAYRASSTIAWHGEATGYLPMSHAWAYVRDELPPDATIAYANTYFTYPLYGFDLRRPVAYAPVRKDLSFIHDLPRSKTLSGSQIVPAVAGLTTSDPDRQAWLDNLRDAGAKYLFIAKKDLTNQPDSTPPELLFADDDAEHFKKLFENEAAAVYELR